MVSAKSGVFYVVPANSGDEGPSLTVLESVRCLECGAVYAKPSGGGTVQQNPGCPDCGYVGWVDVDPGLRKRGRRTAPPRVGSRAAAADDADAAEVMVARRPPAHRPA